MANTKSEIIKEENLILPIISLKNFVPTPLIPQPIKIDDEEQRKILEKCSLPDTKIFLASVRENDLNNKEDSIMPLGVIAVIDRVLQMPGAPSLAFLRPVARAQFLNLVFSPQFPLAKVKPLKNFTSPRRISLESQILIDRIKDLHKILMNFMADPEKSTASKLIEENSPTQLHELYAIAHISPLSWEEKYHILEANSFKSLCNKMATALDEAEQRISIQAAIHERTHHELSRQQKETFLRVHLKQIREELGESEENEDVADLMSKAADKTWNQETRLHFNNELKKLKRLNINNPEYSVQYEYLNSFLNLPWENYNNSNFSLDKVKYILDRDHYGLEKVKERILEYMAVIKLRNDLKAPILCLYGPPGVGKTSIGKSVAEALGREYSRIALGGVHDEAEIRGHRRTYIGAMPGRFIHSLSKCNFGNPLILLDEIDKVGKDYKGDPSSALLEALDPEQNNTFHDNFIDFPYDLSKVLFIATANDLNTIPEPLRDRLEIIEMPKYSLEEKREIALRHLVNKALEENGFKIGEISFSAKAIDLIIKSFTKEAGVRQLGKQLSKIIRKLALRKVKGEKIPQEITPEEVPLYLDKKEIWHSSLGFHA